MRRATPKRTPDLPRRCAVSLLAWLLLLVPLTAAAAGAEVEVRLSEYAIEMPHTLPAGPTTFLVHNVGKKPHSFKIEGPGLSELLAKPVGPGKDSTLQVTLQPGDYKVYCPVGSHETKGMTMTLKVVNPG